VVAEKPQFIPGHLLLAQAHLLKNETALAQESLQSALKIDRGSREALLALARFHALRKGYPKAQGYLERSWRITPTTSRPVPRWATYILRKGGGAGERRVRRDRAGPRNIPWAT
jgi:uncharacterized membrane-anchored protein